MVARVACRGWRRIAGWSNDHPMRSESRKFRPKERIYRGRKFPCKHEERFAIYFDSLGLSWSHEIHTFSLRETTYKPDFFLWDLMTFIEVKPADCLDETWKIHELSIFKPSYCYLVASMPRHNLILHEYARPVRGELRWFDGHEIRWVFCRLCCHPYVSVINPDSPMVSCPRCGFDAGRNSFSNEQVAKIVPVDRAKRWWKNHRGEPDFPKLLVNREYRRAVAGLEGNFDP